MTMKKFINLPERFIDEMLYGLYAAHPSYYTCVNEDAHCLISKQKAAGKVGIATGGGSGHLPLFLGYVGEGMLDGCSVGDIFNFQMAAEMAEMEEDIEVRLSIAGEDVASGPRAKEQERNIRRGVAGIFFVYKCAGAAAAEMLPLDEVYRIAEKTKQLVATMGVAMSPCTVPRIGNPSFTIADDEMEIGMGIHGEAGIRRGKICEADEIVKEILPPVMQDLQLQRGDEVCVLINGLGATPLEEQYLINGLVHRMLKDEGIRVHRTYVGEYATSLEMTGLSISLLKVDEELKRLINAPADTPMFTQFGEAK